MKINRDELLDFNEIKIKGDTSEIDEIIEYEEILFEISKSLKDYRKDNKLTQKQLADILGIDQVMISKLESGNYNPTFKQLHKISRKLTNSADLFTNTLKNIIDKISHMYKIDCSIKIKNKNYSAQSKNSIIYIYNYSCNNSTNKGGNYGGQECTSSISVAG